MPRSQHLTRTSVLQATAKMKVSLRPGARPTRLPLWSHPKRNWRLSSVAPGFTLLDVWRFPLGLEDSVSLDTDRYFPDDFRKLSTNPIL